MLTAMLFEWQELSFGIGSFTAKLHLTSIYWGGFAIKQTVPLWGNHKFSELSGSMAEVRDVACGLPNIPYLFTLCESLTVDFACGVLSVILNLVALLINVVASSYLLYYSWGVTKREYRKVAFRCLCVSPVLMFLSVAVYTGAILFSETLQCVMTPGPGYFIAIFGFMFMTSVPFVSKKWSLSTKEILDDEKRQIRREAKDALLSGQGYGTMYSQHHVESYGEPPPPYLAYPSLHEPYYPEHGECVPYADAAAEQQHMEAHPGHYEYPAEYPHYPLPPPHAPHQPFY